MPAPTIATNAPSTKPIWQSKTAWLAALTIIYGLAGQVQTLAPSLPLTTGQALMVAGACAFILRLVTFAKVTLGGS